MILISHRGNINGRIQEMENNPEYVYNAIQNGYDVEVDVWLKEGELYLGHDHPRYQTDLKFLKNKKIWCHAKTIETLFHLLLHEVHCFYHNTDAVTLTSKGYIWSYPNSELTPLSISLFPEQRNEDLRYCKGICSDNISLFKEVE